MRFEAKHQQLKRAAKSNFKNVPKSVATRHQYNMCLNMLSTPGGDARFLYTGDLIGTGKGIASTIKYYHSMLFDSHIIDAGVFAK